MRNLKKVLSLALALVMLLGMMVVGAGAATKFQDADDIQNKEAVAVLVGMGIMKGREDGTNFVPDGTLTRAEAALMIAQLDLGVEAAAALKGNGTSTFTDVPANHWAAGAIDYCVEQGYIKGDGAGHFLPGRNVSSVEFGSMALRLLGYDANNEGLVGDQWAVKAAALIRKAGLSTSVAANTQPMTRDAMAQMAFNTLTAETVEYNGLNISGDNITITSPATVRRHSANQSNVNTTYDREPIKSNITPIRFCEERFPTLKLDRSGENEFKEAYSVWTYRGLEIEDSKIALNCISTTKKEADNSWMTNVKGFDRSSSIYVNGKQLPDGYPFADLYKLTGNGRLVEVYVNPDDLAAIEKVVVIDTVPGEVTKVASDGKVTIKLLETNGVNPDKSVDVKKNDLVTTDDKTVIDGEFKKGDLVLVNAYGKNPICKDSTVAKVFAPEVSEEFVIRKNYKDGKPVSVDTGDTTGIKDARNVISDFDIDKFTVNDKNKDSVLYLDQYGYIVKIVDWEDTTPKDCLIAVKDVYQDVEGRKIVDRVSGVISNGETIELAYNKDAGSLTVGRIYVYSDNNNDDVYDLKLVDNKSIAAGASAANTYVANKWDTAQSLSFRSNDTKGNNSTNASKYFYSDSVKFIFADAAHKDVTVLNGRQTYSSDKLKVVAQALDKNGEISAVFLEAEPDFVNLDDIIFVWTRKSKDEVVGSDKQTIYYGYEAYNSDGTEIEDFFGTKGDMTGEKDEGKFYKKNIVKDGDVTAYKDTWSTKVGDHTIESNWITYANGTRGDSFMMFGGTKDEVELLTNSKTKVIDLATDGTITNPAELNETMNKDGKAVKVAVVYTKDTVNNTYDVHTIFVTHVGDTGSYKDHEVKPGETPSEKVTVKFDGTAVKGTHYTVEGLTDDKIESGKTFTVKGTDIEMSNGTGYTVKAVTGGYEVTVIAANKTEITVTVDQKGQTSTTNVKFKGGVSTMNGAKVGTSSAMVSSGNVVVTFLMETPDWATTGASVKYNVKVNGKQLNATPVTETLTIAAGATLATGQTADATGVIQVPENASVEIEITEITYTKVKVQVMEGTTDVTKKWTVPADITVGDAQSIAVNTVKFASTDKTAANAPTAKVTGGVKSEVAFTMTYVDGTKTWDNDAKTVDVKGDGPVVITVDTSKLVPSYTITLNDGAGTAPNNNDGKNITDGSLDLEAWSITTGDKAAKVTVAMAAGGTLTTKQGVPFNPANITVKLGTAATAGYEYTVTIAKLGDAKAVIKSTDSTNAVALSVGAVTLTDNMLITKDDIKIECTKQPLAVEKATWTATTMTIVFNQKVDKATAETYSGADAAYSLTDGAAGVVIGGAKLQEDGKTVILTFAGGELAIPDAGNTPKVAVNGVKISDLDGTAFSALAKDEITIAAGGTTNIA